MNQRVHNLSKWRLVEDGQVLSFTNGRQRTVVLDVNCPDEVCFYVIQELEDIEADPERVADEAAGRLQERGPRASEQADGERAVAFLGVAKGRDRFEFAVEGAFDLLVEGGSAYVFTADGLQVETKVVAPVIFTRIANRRQRNPHLEMIEYQMRLNQQRFMEQLAGESEHRIKMLEERVASYAPQRNQRAPDAKVGRPAGGPALDEATGSDDVGPADVATDDSSAGGRPPGKGRAKTADDDE